MKFQNKKVITSEDSGEFLTFRHHGADIIQSTGRSLGNQKIQYKSLQKLNLYRYYEDNNNPINDDEDSEDNSTQHKNKKYLFNVKSQHKLQNFKQQNSHPFPSLEQSSIQINPETKNQILKKKLDRLVKNFKKQQRKQISLDKQIQDLSKQLDDDQQDYVDQEQNIVQLQQIYQQNMNECQKIQNNIKSVKQKNKMLREQFNGIHQNAMSSMSRNQSSRNSKIKNLRQQVANLENIRKQLTTRQLNFKRYLESMQEWLQNIQKIDDTLKTAHKKETKYQEVSSFQY